MRLIARYLIHQENVPRENILCLNFEDDRFAEFKTPDFQTLYEPLWPRLVLPRPIFTC
jgi:hypothetical protein